MKYLKHYIVLGLTCIAGMLCCACSSEEAFEEHVREISLQLSFDGFEGGRTRASVVDNSGTVYIDFGTAKGSATYNSSSQKWTLTYDGDLPETSNRGCTVWYVQGIESTSSTSLTLTPQSVLYTTSEASFTNSTETFSVTATLSPVAPRLRFKGVAGTSIDVSGLQYNTSFSLTDYSLRNSTQSISLTVAEDGYTPYVYVQFVNPDAPELTLLHGDREYSRTFNSGFTHNKQSAMLTIPTVENLLGWSVASNEHEYVDLGLPSGTLWATCNVGARKPEDYGDYFAWGETEPQSGNTYKWSSYKWMASGYSSSKGCTKYTIADNQTSGCWYNNDTYVGTTVNGTTYKNLTELLPEDDAATANWGSDWCMPTHTQQEELVNSSYTTTTWTAENGVYGRKITSKTNGKSIFLPAAGCCDDGSQYRTGIDGHYWSRSLYSLYSYSAWIFHFHSAYVNTGVNYSRSSGLNIRPVCSRGTIPSTIPVTSISLNINDLELIVGETYQLTATVSPSDATNKNVNWSSTASCVEVNANGYITAKSVGEATITATAADGSGVAASCLVKVRNVHSIDMDDFGDDDDWN